MNKQRIVVIIIITLAAAMFLTVIVYSIIPETERINNSNDDMFAEDFGNITFNANIGKQYGIIFRNFNMPNGTKEQQRAFILGFVFGTVGVNNNTNYNLSIQLINNSRDYNLTNFPLEDDCISEDLCFVKYNDALEVEDE